MIDAIDHVAMAVARDGLEPGEKGVGAAGLDSFDAADRRDDGFL